MRNIVSVLSSSHNYESDKKYPSFLFLWLIPIVCSSNFEQFNYRRFLILRQYSFKRLKFNIFIYVGLIGECSIWEPLLLLHNTFILSLKCALKMLFVNECTPLFLLICGQQHVSRSMWKASFLQTHTHTAEEHVEEAKEDSGRAGWQCHAMPCPPHHQHPNHALFHAAIMPRMMPLTMGWGRRTTTPCTNKVSHILRLYNSEEGQPPLCSYMMLGGGHASCDHVDPIKEKKDGSPWIGGPQPASPHPLLICSFIFIIVMKSMQQ